MNSKDSNIEQLLLVLKEFGFESLGLSQTDFSPDSVVQLGYEPNRIDLITSISGIDFQTVYENKVSGKYGDQQTFFISLDDL